MNAEPSRPVLRWHGGKWRLAPWILQHMPRHRVYVEPFGGAGSVLLRKPRTYAEIYNDLDDEVVGLFQVLRDEKRAARLRELLVLTPFSRAEFQMAYRHTKRPLERARRLVIRAFMGFGSDSTMASRPAGFRCNSNRSGTVPAHDWANYPAALDATVARLKGVIIERKPAIAVMRQHDSPGTLHYCDPPYLPETRSALGKKRGDGFLMYRHEMSATDHAELLSFLCGVEGMVMLSSYPSLLYTKMLPGWRCVATITFADGGAPRIENLWLNPACAVALDAERMPLFGRSA